MPHHFNDVVNFHEIDLVLFSNLKLKILNEDDKQIHDWLNFVDRIPCGINDSAKIKF